MTNLIAAFRNFVNSSKNLFANYISYPVRRAAIFRNHLKISGEKEHNFPIKEHICNRIYI